MDKKLAKKKTMLVFEYMKKLILLGVIISAFCIFSPNVYAAPTATIISPNGGESLIAGDTFRISWNSTKVDSVSLMLQSSSGTGDWISTSIKTATSTGTYYYDWKVSTWNTTNTQFKIWLIAYQTGIGQTNDYSDNYFTISQPSTIQTCASFTYSNWSVCSSNNTQIRTIVLSSPSGCTGGSPILQQSCVYTPANTTTSSVTISSPTQPAASLAVPSAQIPFTKISLTAGSSDVDINGVVVYRRNGLYSSSIDSAFAGIVLLDENNQQVGSTKNLSNQEATVGDNFVVKAGTIKTFTVAGIMASNLASYAGQIVYLDITGIKSAATTAGSLPISGAGQTINNSLTICLTNPSVALSTYGYTCVGTSAQTVNPIPTPTPTPTPIATTTQQTGDVDTQNQSTYLDIKNNLRYKMRDKNSNGEVSLLQDFLNYKGFLSYQPTGFFGLATFKAVKDFQKSVDISPTGFVGPLTRAKIKEISGSAN